MKYSGFLKMSHARVCHYNYGALTESEKIKSVKTIKP